MTKRILIVDDEKSVVLALKDVFSAKGYDVLTALTGSEAVECLGRDVEIDLILLDIQMPGINGLQVLKEVKEKRKRIRAIVLSGVLDEYKNEVERIGCDAFLSKPFSVKMLIRVCEDVLGESKDGRAEMSYLLESREIIPAARLLFIEPNEIMYSAKFAYFNDVSRCGGEYEIMAAFAPADIEEKLKLFKPDIVISNINMFHLYRLNEKIAKLKSPPKDVILYGLPVSGEVKKEKNVAFISGLFDPVTTTVRPREMDKLNNIIRSSAIASGLYRKREK